MAFYVTPDILSAAVSWFNGAANFAAGDYTVYYSTGAMKQSVSAGWISGTVEVTDGAGNNLAFNLGTQYASQALAQSANIGASEIYHHVGGPIGIYSVDSIYGDNIAGSPNPTFGIVLGGLIPPVPPTIAGFGLKVSGVLANYVYGN